MSGEACLPWIRKIHVVLCCRATSRKYDHAQQLIQVRTPFIPWDGRANYFQIFKSCRLCCRLHESTHASFLSPFSFLISGSRALEVPFILLALLTWRIFCMLSLKHHELLIDGWNLNWEIAKPCQVFTQMIYFRDSRLFWTAQTRRKL